MTFSFMLCALAIPMASASSTTQLSTHHPSDPDLSISSIEPVEGSRFFSLDVNYRLKGKGMDYSAHWKSRVNPDAIASFIQITPHVDVQIIPSPESFRLIGTFEPATRYSMHFRTGLGDNQHAWLRKDKTVTITTPSFKSNMSFLSKARYLPRMDGVELPFEYRNVDHARIKVLRVPPQNLVFWMSQNNGRYTSAEVAEAVLTKDVKLTMKQDKSQRSAVDLSALKDAGKGVYEVNLFQLRGKKHMEHAMDSSLIVVTDLAAIAKKSDQDLHVWTRSARDFTKKTGVQVRVMSYNNFEIASCISDATGACVLQGVMKQKKKPYALILSTDDDLSYLRFSDVALDNGDAKQLRPYDSQHTALESYVYSSRGVYRPGETVDLAAITWTGAHQAAKSVPLQWKILTPRQQVLREVSVRSSTFGMSALQLRLNDYATTGKYQVIVSSGKKQLGTMGFFVEEFMPERIALKVETKQPWVVAEHSADFDLDARYLFGPAVDGGQYQARFSLQPAWYTIPNHADFSTGTYQLHKKAAIMLPPSMGTLDAYGRASISAMTKQLSASFPTVMKLTARVDVNEAGSGRMTHREQSMLVAAQAQILGLHAISHDHGVVHVEGRTFNPEGKAVSAQSRVKLSLWQVYFNWNYSWNPETGRDEWHAERLLMPTGTEGGANLKKGHFTAKLPLTEEWGEYIVRATMADGQIADLPVTVGYPWYWSEASKDGNKPPAPDQLRLHASHSEANAGDAVEFSFEAPFAGQALFTLES
ncbi:MAG: MG2 domain-containing protein, partial [Mariprofundaceae bacterium]|nr:MG2 domain-containing protein [Mariprofundaceae bacterium]